MDFEEHIIMIRKPDISLRIGMFMLVLCVALVLTVLPAAASYYADNPLTEYAHGTITGNINYTYGDSYYSPKMWSNDNYVYTTRLPQAVADDSNVSVVIGRLYVYWTWSFNDTDPNSSYDTGVLPIMNVTFNDVQLTLENRSYDRKGYGNWDYPSGTDCYNVTSEIIPSLPENIVNITNAYGSDKNQSFNIQAVGLLTLTNFTSDCETTYWIFDGCDMTYLNSTVTPALATSYVNISGVNTSDMSHASLITAIPAGNTENNTLYFNDQPIATGLWDGNPRDGNFSYNVKDITSYIENGDNSVGIRNGLPNNDYTYTDKQMQAANVILYLQECHNNGCHCYSTNPFKFCVKTTNGCICDYADIVWNWTNPFASIVYS
ncbi:DUF3344 domain-containing protein [Methanosarcina acetivorans]|nr:DUF3344 domain-containing protein [Methanosarcina acetivorans]